MEPLKFDAGEKALLVRRAAEPVEQEPVHEILPAAVAASEQELGASSRMAERPPC
jgi:hypothetical protein